MGQPLFPQAEVAQDAFDDFAFVDESNNAHFARTGRTNQRIGLPDLFDELSPFWGRRSPRAMLEDGDNFDPVAGRLFPGPASHRTGLCLSKEPIL